VRSSSTATTPAATAGVPCGPAHARTLASDAVARVYVAGGAVRGCTSGARRSWVLASATRAAGAPRLSGAVLEGRIAAYTLTRMGVDTGSAVVTARRLSDGRTLVETAANTAPLRPESFVSVPGLVLGSGGALAWISEARSVIGGSGTVQVHAWQRGVGHVLDAGPGVVPGSLRLRGTRLSWQHGATTRSATL
jgi:hypothetical protein